MFVVTGMLLSFLQRFASGSSTLLYTTSWTVISKQTSEKLRHQLNQVFYRSSGANALWRALAEPWTVGNTVIHWATQSFTSVSAYPDGIKGTKGQ